MRPSRGTRHAMMRSRVALQGDRTKVAGAWLQARCGGAMRFAVSSAVLLSGEGCQELPGGPVVAAIAWWLIEVADG